MAKISDFLPYVLPYVADCPSPLAEQHVRDICIDFCASTLIDQRLHEPITGVKGTNTYDLSPPTGYQVHTVLQAWYESRPLHHFSGDSPQTRAELFNRSFPNAQKDDSTPSSYMLDGHTTFVLDAAPRTTVPNAITMRVALTPTRKSEVVPDILLSDYAYEIGQGVVARLVLIPNQAFSNPNMADAYMAAYHRAKMNARIQANKSFGRTQSRIRPYPLA